MNTYEQYESAEDREKAIKDARREGYEKGRELSRKEWNLSAERWKRFKPIVIAFIVAIVLFCTTVLIVGAVVSNNNWNEELRTWKVDCVAKGGIIVPPDTETGTSRYLCVIGKVDSSK